MVAVFRDRKRQKSKISHKFLAWDTMPGASRENHEEVDLFRGLFFPIYLIKKFWWIQGIMSSILIGRYKMPEGYPGRNEKYLQLEICVG